ncbi:hypothetical protein PoB_002617200 [Plakobranchus ocellatus]|uniref:Transcription initiation factor TFIID 150 kDa subunit n=1 Tax=Plakobranchus ocellatus TaxID=259542 RepID=A0AAV3ZYN3_9GAST|nr:hypothetical protein PoB_002617200 [Plakobranchus ocellatus]
MHEVTHFCLPGLMPVLKHTTSYIHQAFEFYEELMSSRYPYSYYKQVFVDMAYCDVSTYSTLSILSTNLLHPPNIIDQTTVSRQLMAAAVAQQFFGSFIAMETWCDAWLTKGITGYLSYLFTKRTFGNNEYRYWVMKDLQEVCKYEHEVGPVVLDPSKHPETASAHHPFWLCSSHTLSPCYAEVLSKKARLIVRMLEMRIGTELLLQVLNKLLSLAYNASQATFNFSSWTNMLLSTSSFLKIIYTVTGKDIEPFIDQWVYPFFTVSNYQGGCARFTGSFVFNRKRNVVELDIKQDLNAPGALKFVGTLNVTIQELDGSFNHQFKIEENKTKFEITCHSKSRRNKKKKIPLMTGEEVDMDLTAMDADSPVLWLRLDPDLQLVRTVQFEQPDYMWQYQLKFERCIVAQFEAIQALANFPTPASRYALNDTIENEECYYRVRQEACHCLAKIANLMTGTWTGPPAMITIFRKLFGSHSCPVIIRQNNFSNFQHYYLLKTMPQAMARLRDTHNLCLTDITKFLLDLFKYNDNSRNKWSDNYYRASLVDALAATITPAVTNVSLITGQEVTAESLSAEKKLVLEEVVRCLNLEKLMPSYKFTVTVSCLNAIRTLQKFGHLPNDSHVFKDYAQPGIFRDVRIAAITCLVDFIKGDLSGEHLNWVLDLIENEADPYLRYHALTRLIENPPFRSSERCALNVETLVERLWSMMCKTSYDSRLRCGLADLYYTLYGRQRPTCLPEPEAVKMMQSEEKPELESSKELEAGFTPSNGPEGSPAAGTSAIWNPELSSIFAPAVETEVVEAPVLETTEETVVTDFPPTTVKVDLDSDVADESMDRTPVDLTMISGETVVAMEESVVTEPSITDNSQEEIKAEPVPDTSDVKEEVDEEIANKEEESSHLSEDFGSPSQSPEREAGTPGDVIISLDNLIKSHTDVPDEVYAEDNKEPTPPSSPAADQSLITIDNSEQASRKVPGLEEEEIITEARESLLSPDPDIIKSSDHEEEAVVPNPPSPPPPRRRSLRSSSHLTSPSPPKEATKSPDEEESQEEVKEHHDSPSRLSTYSEYEEEEGVVVEEIILDEADVSTPPPKSPDLKSPASSPPAEPPPPAAATEPSDFGSPYHQSPIQQPAESPSASSPHLKHQDNTQWSPTLHKSPTTQAALDAELPSASPLHQLPSETRLQEEAVALSPAVSSPQMDIQSTLPPSPTAQPSSPPVQQQEEEIASEEPPINSPSPLPPQASPPSVPQETVEKPLILKRKISFAPSKEDSGSAEPEFKRLVPPIILSSTLDSASSASGASSHPSLKTTFKLSATGVSGEWEQHHHHHKSKKKKKKNKHKHKHKHRRDRQEGEEREEKPDDQRPRERLVLDMSSRSRMAAVSEDEGSSD